MFESIPNQYWGRAAESAHLNGITEGLGEGLGILIDEPENAFNDVPVEGSGLEGLEGLSLGDLGADAAPWWQNLLTWGTDTAGKILVPRFSLPAGSYEQRDASGNVTVVRQAEGVPLAFGAGQYGVGGQAVLSAGTGYGISTGMLIAIGVGAFALIMLSRGGGGGRYRRY